MLEKIESMSDAELVCEWRELQGREPDEIYDREHSVTVSEWSARVHTAMINRGLIRTQ